MKKPLISYVITAYNIENFIEESIECAFNQTYQPLEIILSDDCSTDKTFEKMKEMASKYRGPHTIILNKNNQNMGITKHMNKAYLELANGEIIIAAHGDDLSDKNRTLKSYEYLSQNPDCTAISFSIEQVDENGRTIESKKNEASVNEIKIYNLDNPLDKGIANIPAPSRAFYKRVMTYFGEIQDSCPTEDELISFRSLLLGYNAFLPEVMVKYRKHKDSSSNPENFHRFPLEKIYNQQKQDMYLAIKKGILTNDKMEEIDSVLIDGIKRRKLYRAFFKERSLKNLAKILISKNFNIRLKLHYIKRYLMKY